ncbi:hypothetical protein U1Q18_001496 [Sarracenia purpurea var. burkii]
MKRFVCTAVLLTLLFVPTVISERQIARQHSHQGHLHPTPPDTEDGEMVKPNIYRQRSRPAKHRRGGNTVQIPGSSLPDCSHACGPCSPCRLVMVSFVCASLAEAETCPVAYKCMCNSKSYPVP